MIWVAISSWVSEVIGFLLYSLNDPPMDLPAGKQVAAGEWPGLWQAWRQRDLHPSLRKQALYIGRRRLLKWVGFLLLISGFGLQFIYLATQLKG
jgi:hypothetical protein